MAMAYIAMAYTAMAYIVMAYTVTACIVIACIAMAHTVIDIAYTAIVNVKLCEPLSPTQLCHN